MAWSNRALVSYTMRHFAIFVALSLRGIVASVLNSISPVICPSAIVVNSTIFNIDGNEITRTILVCPDGDFPVMHPSTLASRTSVPRFNNTLELGRRNVGECRTPVPECQCGQTSEKGDLSRFEEELMLVSLAFCSCNQVTPSPPDGSDCQTLVRSLVVLPEVAGPTFVVPAQGSQLLQFHTCEQSIRRSCAQRNS